MFKVILGSILMIAAGVLSWFGYSKYYKGGDGMPFDPNDIYVQVLTDATIDEVIKNNEHILIEFYAPWCGHCKALAPEYGAAAKELNGTGVVLAKVDATEQKEAAAKYEVQGFPTLFWFSKGEKMDYGGGRDKDTIVRWIKKRTGPPSRAVTCDELATTVEDNKFAMAYFGEETESFYVDGYVPFAQGDDSMEFVHSNDANCAKKHGVTAPGLAFFRKFEEKVVVYTGEANKEAIGSWVKPLKVATVFAFTDDDIEVVFGEQNSALFLFRAEKDKDSAFQKTFEDAAYANKGKLVFSYSDVADGIQERLADFMGVTADMMPIIYALVPSKEMAKYRMPSPAAEWSVETISAFVGDVLEGKAEAHLKSEEIPETNDGPVTVVVGKSFEEIVMDPTKDVFIKYYAPWCGHCKSLAPIWDEVGAHFKDSPNVVIAKLDATANEHAQIQVEGFPTLHFYPADNKAPIAFDGERQKDPLIAFVKEHSKQLQDGSAIPPKEAEAAGEEKQDL